MKAYNTSKTQAIKNTNPKAPLINSPIKCMILEFKVYVVD